MRLIDHNYTGVIQERLHNQAFVYKEYSEMYEKSYAIGHPVFQLRNIIYRGMLCLCGVDYEGNV